MASARSTTSAPSSSSGSPAPRPWPGCSTSFPATCRATAWPRTGRGRPGPLVLVFTAICFVVTILFRADVDAQAGAYATGVLAVITSATVAVTLSARRSGDRSATLAVRRRSPRSSSTPPRSPSSRTRKGLQIALFFIGAIVVTSLVSRVWRSTELRATEVVLDEAAARFVDEAARARRSSASSPTTRTTGRRASTC